MPILVSTFTGFVSISAFVLLICVPVGITSSAVEIKIYMITVAIKKYQSIIRKKKKRHNKIVLRGKIKLDTNEVLISKSLIGSWRICLKWKKKFCVINYIKTMETYCSVVKDILLAKIQVSEKLNKTNWGFYEIALVVAKNWLLLKIKNSTILIIFEMISLK